MACRSAAVQRANYALEQLLAGRSPSGVVSDLSEREGVSRRTAQRAVAKAHQTLVQDLDATERVHLVAQLTHLLLESAAEAMKQKNSGAVVGISRELRSLLGLGAEHRQLPHGGTYGRSKWQ